VSSRYDELDAATELEQALDKDLRAAFEPRGCVVEHRGTANRHAPGGGSDILVRDPKARRLILVEATKRIGTQADGEFPAIVAHLDAAIATGGYDDYGVLYISPKTSARMRASIADMANRHREREGKKGRIIAIDFDGADAILTRLASAAPDRYPSARLGEVFRRWEEGRDDVRTLRLFVEALFGPSDQMILDLDKEARAKDTAAEQELRKRIEGLEDKLRPAGITGPAANETMVQLTFMRLFEEKRQRETGKTNRMTAEGFARWTEHLDEEPLRAFHGRLVEYLFHQIAEDPMLRSVGLLRERDGRPSDLNASMNDRLLTTLVFPIFDDYDFSGSLLDVLGVVFETMARRAEKDTKIGQFFTPAEVVEFCGKMAGLSSRDVVLDPAVGTGRFLIAAMDHMLAAAPSEGGDLAKVQARIRERQLLGIDLDPWVSTIAKMNMFIHGDGKSNVEQGNGLVLSDRNILRAFPAGISGQVDVVLTNPPLGNVSYLRAAEMWKEVAPDVESDDYAVADYFRRLGVVPMADAPLSPEERRQRRDAGQVERLNDQLRSLLREPATAARDRRIESVQKSLSKTAKDMTKPVKDERAKAQKPTGEMMKGGALFLGAMVDYLKPVRDPSARYEWQGGRAVIVVDEAILNTPDYAKVRAFLREHYFIKAVVSLGRQAFEYLAHTSAKTSIMFLVRKPDPKVVQTEPIFYAHAERCGYSRVGKWIGSDLPAVLAAFGDFSTMVERSYRGADFDARAFAAADDQRQTDPTREADYLWHAAFDTEGAETRLDYYNTHYRSLCRILNDGGAVRLGDIIEFREGKHPQPERTGAYAFAAVERNTATVNPKGVQQVSYAPRALWVVEEGDIVLSGMDLVHGSVAIAGPEVRGMVMSKEMYAYRVKDGVAALPGYIALMLRSPLARDLIFGLVSGTSNRTRLSDAEQLLDIPFPALPGLDVQHAIVTEFEQSVAARRVAVRALGDAEAKVAVIWPKIAAAVPEEDSEAA
jgi:type I restriction-modification system DNA methylase subunit